ncbi:MAG: DUF2497 domain-containing protein [Pseudomonadota bacterium]
MAEEAHKEPSMEEILASIRKIISEDDDSRGSEAAANELRPEEITTGEDTSDDEGLSLDALASETRDETDDIFEEFDLSDLEEEAVSADTVDDSVIEDDASQVAEAEGGDYDDLDGFDDEPTELVEDDFDSFMMPEETVEEEAFAAADEPEFETDAAPTPAVTQHTSPEAPAEPPMQALTEEATETAAAGALAKLVAKMDMGSENTLEGMVRELVKPMIKEWLDANLPDIVEDKVELEVQRISRLAR